MMTPQKTHESMLAWRCGYAAGIRSAIAIIATCDDPRGRLEREFDSVAHENRELWKQADGPREKLN